MPGCYWTGRATAHQLVLLWVWRSVLEPPNPVLAVPGSYTGRRNKSFCAYTAISEPTGGSRRCVLDHTDGSRFLLGRVNETLGLGYSPGYDKKNKLQKTKVSGPLGGMFRQSGNILLVLVRRRHDWPGSTPARLSSGPNRFSTLPNCRHGRGFVSVTGSNRAFPSVRLM